MRQRLSPLSGVLGESIPWRRYHLPLWDTTVDAGMRERPAAVRPGDVRVAAVSPGELQLGTVAGRWTRHLNHLRGAAHPASEGSDSC